MRIFSSAEYCRRVARRMFRMAFSALSFFFVIIVPLLSYDEPKVSLIQTTQLVRVSLTGNTSQGPIEISLWGLVLKGPAGPLMMWVVVFLAIVLGIKALWNKNEK